MPDDPYGIDPEILKYSTLSPPPSRERGIDIGIGLGSPRFFPFKQGQPLGSEWSLRSGSFSVVPKDGFLQLQGPINQGRDYTGATIVRPFSLNQASVTIAFSLRVNQVSLDGIGALSLYFAPNLSLVWPSDFPTNAFYPTFSRYFLRLRN